MTDEILMKQLKFIRSITLNALDKSTEEMADQVPTGFHNTIRWNLGHILVVQERLLFSMANEPTALPENYEGLFAPGTKPADWTTEPPTLETLRTYLAEQPARIEKTFSGRLSEELPTPFKLGSHFEMKTIAEAFTFSLFHEGSHYGSINALKRAIEAASL